MACLREMLRSVRRTVFSSPRPIEYSSRTSGSGVRFPSSSSIVSFHIHARLTKLEALTPRVQLDLLSVAMGAPPVQRSVSHCAPLGPASPTPGLRPPGSEAGDEG